MMKTIQFLRVTGLLAGLLLISTITYGQQRQVSGAVKADRNNTLKAGPDEHEKLQNLDMRSSAVMKPGKNGPDTLNYPLPGEYVLYISDGGGYVAGNNEYGDLAKANYFSIDQPYYITGILIDFGVATGGNVPVEIAIWDNSGPNASPGIKLGSETIGLQTIINDVQNETTTYIAFDPPVNIPGSFYAGVLLPSAQGDTVAIYTNTSGDTSPATAWEQWSDFSWHAYDDPSGWALEVSHAIFPIVMPGELLEAGFSASATAVLIGGSVQFTDLSKGDPESWAWTFEGGNPAASNLQNPEVQYPAEGSYSVSLTVTKGSETSTKTIANFITVADVIPPVVDTLNFPLPGSFTLYILNNNGGYVNGNNVYNDLAKANYFPFSDDARITGILFDFAVAIGANPTIELAVWNNAGGAGSPGSKIAQTTISLNAIKSDIQNEQLTYVPFNPPVDINQPFYAGFLLPTASGDTLVVWGNDDGDTNPGTAWEMWDDNSWHAFSSQASWQLNIALGIHPIVEYVTGISDYEADHAIQVIPNPGNGIFWLSSPDRSYEYFTLQVISLQGKMVYESELDFQNGNIKLDLSHLKPGFYFLKGLGLKPFSAKVIIH